MALTFPGCRKSDGGYNHLNRYDEQVFIERIDALRRLTPEEFELIRSQIRAPRVGRRPPK